MGFIDLPSDPEIWTGMQSAALTDSMWFEDGDFVLRCGDTDVYIGPTGKHLLYNKVDSPVAKSDP